MLGLQKTKRPERMLEHHRRTAAIDTRKVKIALMHRQRVKLVRWGIVLTAGAFTALGLYAVLI